MDNYDSDTLERIAHSLEEIADTFSWLKYGLWGLMALGGVYLIGDIIKWFRGY